MKDALDQNVATAVTRRGGFGELISRGAFERDMTRYDLEQLQVTWLDSARIARRAWPDSYGSRGWGLENIAKNLTGR